MRAERDALAGLQLAVLDGIRPCGKAGQERGPLQDRTQARPEFGAGVSPQHLPPARGLDYGEQNFCQQRCFRRHTWVVQVIFDAEPVA